MKQDDMQEVMMPEKERSNQAGKLKKEKLNHREIELLYMMSNGATTSELAATLFLAIDTIEGLRGRILKKLEARNSTQAVAYALRNHLMD